MSDFLQTWPVEPERLCSEAYRERQRQAGKDNRG